MGGEAQMQREPILFTGGEILTMDRAMPRAEAVLVRDGRIAAVGSRSEVEEQSGGARRVDLDGRALIPGFNDSHCHILSFGLDLGRLDVSADAVSSIADIERLLAEQAERAGAEEWIVGRGYDQNHLREGRHPTRQELDRAARGRPVVLWHTSGHVLTASSRALEIAGISSSTAAPAGGEIERDEHGEPTGLLMEAPAMNLLDRHVPSPTRQQCVDAIVNAMEVMARQGITSASDAATGEGDAADDEVDLYRAALDGGRLLGRITLMPQIMYVAPPGTDTVRSRSDFEVGDRPDRLRIGPTKIFSDGALSTRTAAVRQPYQGSDNLGILIWDQQVLEDMVDRAHRGGWQIAVHALGDRAIEVVLDAYERALQRSPRGDHRHRIEHCMMADQDLCRRIARLGVVPSLQPDIFRLGDGYITALGLERASRVIPATTFARLGVPVAFSSDRPVVPGDPLECILDAMRRTTPAGVTLGPEFRVSAEEAIRYYTAGGAYATHADSQIGTITLGKLADLAVLSQDPTRTEPEEWDRVMVNMTVVGGEIVYGG
jgi:predicted amidohydrolase YtcJ